MSNSMELRDHQEREIIISKLDSNIMVEAGAGSGKTTSMVNRMISLLATGTTDIDSMVAVTFTNKAAADLKEKFQEKLEETLTETPGDDKKYGPLKDALNNLEQANISTIHTFCGNILRERPAEAGVDPDFKILEGAEKGAFIEEYWHHFLDSDSSLRRLQREHDIPLKAMFAAYKTMLEYPDTDFIIPPAEHPDLKPNIPLINGLLDEMEELFLEVVPEKGWDDFYKAVVNARAILKTEDDDPAIFKALNGLDKKDPVTQNRWQSGKHVSDQQKAFKRDVSDAACRAWRDYLYTELMPLLIKAARGYQDWLLSRGYLDFNDLLLSTAKLLRSNPQARSFFAERYTHILIDEFQDTDPVQAEILLLLTATDANEANWQKCTPRPGSLFIVGDPKQSIYRFRRADIDLYNKTLGLITRSGGLALNLTSNFRSFDTIVDFVNTTFSHVFTPEPTQFQAQRADLDAVYAAAKGVTSGVFVINTPAGSKKDVWKEDARLVADWIEESLQMGLLIHDSSSGNTRPCQARDFMVITPKRAELDTYAKAFTDRGIPIRIKGAKPTEGNHLLLEFVKLLSAIAQPENDIGILSVLRGLFFGISDQQLYDHNDRGGNWDIIQSDKGETGTLKALATINKFYQWSRTIPVDRALADIISDLGIIPYATSTDIFEGDGAAIIHLVELISHYANQEHLNFPKAVRFVKDLIAGDEDIELACLDTGTLDSVLLLNVHQAKGLEAPVVLLAAPNSFKKKKPFLYVSRQSEIPVGYLAIKDDYSTYSHPGGWDEFSDLEEDYGKAEAERLVYVAATRAKQMLVVCTTGKKSHWSLLDGHLANAEALDIPDAKPKVVTDAKRLARESSALVAGYKLFEPSVNAVKDFLTTKTYEDARVTDPDKKLERTGDRAGMGKKWGSLVHDILRLAIESDEDCIEKIIPAKLEQYGFAGNDIEQLRQTMNNVFQSEIWRRSKNAKERLAEASFVAAFADPIPGIVSGSIDLVFFEDGGWVIVDYKTDIVKDDLDVLTDIHRDQIEEYSRCWAHCTGQPAKEIYLFFATSGDIVAV